MTKVRTLLQNIRPSFLPPSCPQGNGPLAEIDLWRERNATLSALTEQVKLPVVKKVLHVLEIANTGIVDNLQVVINELSKHHVEAVDNVRFLSTLERHLKVRMGQLVGLDERDASSLNGPPWSVNVICGWFQLATVSLPASI